VNRIERLTATLLLLQEQPRTAEQIARHFEVSRRTVLRDVQALCEMGVPVIAREGVGGGYSLPPGYRLAPLPLNAGEAFLLLLALRTLTQLSDAPFARERASLAAKLRALLPAGELPGVELLLENVSVEIPRRPERAPFLAALVEAAGAGQWVRVEYQSAERRSVQHLLPRQLTSQGGYWYCRAYSYEREEERTYRIDRIHALEPAPAWLQGAPAPAAQPYDHPEHPQVVALLSPRGAALAEAEPHVGSRIERAPDGAGRLAFRCPPAELEYYARFFAGLADEVTVEAPAELRARLAAIARSLAKRYREW
jgi:predicted DNA-binding transcriptional regulator YafY